MGDLQDAAERGHIGKVPHYNSIFNVLDWEELTPILEHLITKSALPLKALETDFSVDSTGIGTQLYYRHYSANYGKEKERKGYLKVHGMIGTRNYVIVSAKVTTFELGDHPMLAPLVTDAAKHFNVERVSAVRAYTSTTNLDLIESVGAVPYLPFKSNAIGNSKSATWNRLFHFFHLHRDELLHHCHRRSNVGSTFSSMKRKFGDTLRSRTRRRSGTKRF